MSNDAYSYAPVPAGGEMVFPTQDDVVAHNVAVAAEVARLNERTARYLSRTSPAELAADAIEELREMFVDGSLELRTRFVYDTKTLRV